MKILALDTATETCSAALLIDGELRTRSTPTARGHAQLLLPMIDELLAESALSLRALDAIAFGRGPGAFTGLRLAASVTQGLAFATGLPVLPVSNLRALALQAGERAAGDVPGVDAVLVCQDARMHEVYWALYSCDPHRCFDTLEQAGQEQVGPPAGVTLAAWSGPAAPVAVAVGSGVAAYAADLAPVLGHMVSSWTDLVPRAGDIARLGAQDFASGLQRPAEEALPVYLRDNVAWPPAVR